MPFGTSKMPSLNSFAKYLCLVYRKEYVDCRIKIWIPYWERIKRYEDKNYMKRERDNWRLIADDTRTKKKKKKKKTRNKKRGERGMKSEKGEEKKTSMSSFLRSERTDSASIRPTFRKCLLMANGPFRAHRKSNGREIRHRAAPKVTRWDSAENGMKNEA